MKLLMLLITFFGFYCTEMQVDRTKLTNANNAYCDTIKQENCKATDSSKPVDKSPHNKDLADHQDDSQNNEESHGLDEDQVLNPNLLSFITELLDFKLVSLHSNYDKNFYHFNYQFSHLRPPC
jgi:hypothetical protein